MTASCNWAKAEQRRLNKSENKNSKRIYRQKH